MAKQDKSKLKDWFRTGKYPTQEQFWDWMDSYIHRDDKLDIAVFPELDGILRQKIDKVAFQYHLDHVDNPHQVTKAQIGLGNVNDTADMDKPISLATQNALDLKADKTHLEDVSNPHKVTKQQVGLGNVDNTADLDKPISKATQIALYEKANHTHIHDVDTLEGFDTDVTLAANSDEKVASQKAVKAYVDTMKTALQEWIAKLETQLIPGMIMAWKGSISTIPAGWKLCEELKDKFILGAGADFVVGATGGARTHQLTVEEMPTHGHPIRNVLLLDTNDGVGVFSAGDRTKSTFSSPSTDKMGGNQPHQNMPPYYALAYIEYVGFGDTTV